MNSEQKKAQFYWGSHKDEQILDFMKQYEISPGKYFTNDPMDEKRLKYAFMIAKERNILPEEENKAQNPSTPGSSTTSIPNIDAQDLLNQMTQAKKIPGKTNSGSPAAMQQISNSLVPQAAQNPSMQPTKPKIQTNTTTAEKFEFICEFAKNNKLNYKISKNDIILLESIAPGACDPEIKYKDETRINILKMFYDSAVTSHSIQKENKLDHNGLRPYPTHFQKMTQEIADFWWGGIDPKKAQKFIEENATTTLTEAQEKKYHSAVFLLKDQGLIEVKNKPIQNDTDLFFEIVQVGSSNILYLTPKETLNQSYISPLSISDDIQDYITSIMGGKKDSQGLYTFPITADQEDIIDELEEFEYINLQYTPLCHFKIK